MHLLLPVGSVVAAAAAPSVAAAGADSAAPAAAAVAVSVAASVVAVCASVFVFFCPVASSVEAIHLGCLLLEITADFLGDLFVLRVFLLFAYLLLLCSCFLFRSSVVLQWSVHWSLHPSWLRLLGVVCRDFSGYFQSEETQTLQYRCSLLLQG